jgi:hypothetical protein
MGKCVFHHDYTNTIGMKLKEMQLMIIKNIDSLSIIDSLGS